MSNTKHVPMRMQQDVTLCFPCAARCKTAVMTGLLDPVDANVAMAITWAPIVTDGGIFVLPVCQGCIPTVGTSPGLDTTTRIPASMLAGGHNNGV